MELGLAFVVSAGIVAFYTSFNGGANDLANSFGTSVGSGAITLRGAVIIAAFANLAGAILVGGYVTNTIRKGIVDPTPFAAEPGLLMLGMLAALLAAGLFLHGATHLGLPVSTTHSTVGAILGFGLVAGGWGAISWAKMAEVVASWFTSPLLGAVLGFVSFVLIRRHILNASSPVREMRRIGPLFVGFVFFMICLAFLYKGLKRLHLDLSLGPALAIGAAVGLVASLITAFILRRSEEGGGDPMHRVEGFFRYLQIITAGYVAFAHGANDVANGIGPFAAIVHIFRTGDVGMKVEVPVWILALGGVGIVTGLGIMGHKVIATVGKKITEITPSRGFSAEFAAATTVLIFSRMGLPISTTHTLVGAVIGVGLARGIGALDLRIIGRIFVSWFLTVPITALFAIGLYEVMILWYRPELVSAPWLAVWGVLVLTLGLVAWRRRARSRL